MFRTPATTRRYPETVTRREDQWSPFMGYCIAPCFLIWCKHAWAAKVPAILFGSMGLPAAAASLTYAVGRRAHLAIPAALLMMAQGSQVMLLGFIRCSRWRFAACRSFGGGGYGVSAE